MAALPRLAWRAVDAIARDIAGATTAHAALGLALAGLTDAEVARPSLLPGWTVGHVLAHIARNADSHTRVLQAANRGEVAEQYPHGMDQRVGEIEAGAARPAAEHVSDVADACARLEAAWAAMTPDGWAGEGHTVHGPVPASELPFRRWREVVVHHADLGLGYSWRDWPADYVRLELARATMLWASRRPMGMTSLPSAAIVLDDRQRLAWLLGRAEVDGLDPAGIM